MMNRYLVTILACFCLLSAFNLEAQGADLFVGDAAIYGAGGTVDLRPNVLFVVDNSAFMEQGALGTPYDPTETYAGPYTSAAVYRRLSATGGTINYDAPASPFIADVSSITCTDAATILNSTSYYTGPLQSNGACRGRAGFYYTGNLLNYITNPPPGASWTPSTDYEIGDYVQVEDTTSPGDVLYYEAVSAGNSGGVGSEPLWGTADVLPDGGSLVWEKAGNVMDMVKDAIALVVERARAKAKFGLMVFGDNGQGGQVIAKVEKVASDDTLAENNADGPANYTAFLDAVENIDFVDANITQPMNEALWDAKLYFEDNYNSVSTRMGTDPGGTDLDAYATPVECEDIQPNFVVMLTMGSAFSAGANGNTIGDQDAAYNFGDVDDAAKRLYNGNITATAQAGPVAPADPVIHTSVIKLVNEEPGSAADLTLSPLRRAAAYGHGTYYHANNSSELAEALLDAMNNIVLETDTSFVAPVVPTSPENRTYSGQRVYLGFFRPVSKKPWYGNLKKFGIDSQNRIIDKDGALAAYQSGDNKGNFTPEAKSFWNDLADGGLVEVGGSGEVLLGQSSRNIYTYMGSSSDLNDSSNLFTTANAGIAYDTTLGLTASTDRDKLIDYVRGIDTWDDDGDLDTTEKREWILGDILHSKPQVVNYNQYTFNATNEASCSTNKALVYVGANDGMLHAFRDCDGSEAWAFIPPDLLDDLKLLPPGLHSQFNTSGAHAYFVDGSPTVYKYDADDDGNIGPAEAADGDGDDGSDDLVVLLFGLRRGGDVYYALDITDPEDPQYMWKINGDADGATATTGFEELGQTWSTPQLGKIKVDVSGTLTEKIVAFVGGGYDVEEDSRYGGATRFPVPTEAEMAEGQVVSVNTTDPWGPLTNRPNARGRAVYVFEVATLSSGGVPTKASTATKVWGYTGSNAIISGDIDTRTRYLLKYAIPSDITVADTDFNGLVDRLYVGDLNGRVYALEVGSTNVSQWYGRNIFYDYRGRKMFYRPSISVEKGGTVLVAIGSGDRAHPLNTYTYEYFYVIKDKGQTGSNASATGWDVKYYVDLEDVTMDYLQYDTGAPAGQSVSEILARLNSASNYGWYIKLNRYRSGFGYGEKVLASPLLFNKIAYFTTFIPEASTTTDACTPGNLGVSRLYAVDYLTGEAVLNFSGGNDSEDTDNNNRAVDDQGNVLRRADREITLGVGIPSGLVVLMPASGDAQLLIGCGGGLCSEDPVLGGTIIPIYWMQW